VSESIWLGYDSREVIAFSVARYSIMRFNKRIPIYGLVLDELQKKDWYKRPTEVQWHNGHRLLIDVPSRRADYDGRMSTEFAVSRFLVPKLAKSGWALFADSDIMVMDNITKLFELAQRDKAVMVVKHNYAPKETVKKEGQLQTAYPRKNWSSVMLFNCEHPAHNRLTLELINSLPALELHKFFWLEDHEIGELPPRWNYLVGETELDTAPALVHFTRGLPNMPGYEQQEFADEWRRLQPYSVGALSNGGIT
jgi:lipopolysaccharide biosynthesis glycosyltransferase